MGKVWICSVFATRWASRRGAGTEGEETRIRMQMMMLRERWMHSLKFSEKRNTKRMARPRPRPPNPSLGSFTYLPTTHDIYIYIFHFPLKKDPERKTHGATAVLGVRALE